MTTRIAPRTNSRIRGAFALAAAITAFATSTAFGAIDGSGKYAIDGSGKNAIDGSGKNAIDGSGKELWSANDVDSDFETLVRGPIESIDSQSGIAIVLGQKVAITSATMVESAHSNMFEVGQFVEVAGMAFDGGVIASTIRISDGIYVPGASTIQVSGVVSSVDGDTGMLRIGNLEIDANSAKHRDLTPGEFATITGKQPARKMRVLAD